MIKRTIPLAITAALLAGCITAQARTNEDGSVTARLGQTVRVGGPRVTPLQVLEDSRCPMEARCIWAGRVRLSVRVVTGRTSAVREIASDKPLQVADGQLELSNVMPPRNTQYPLRPRDYRFSFKFSGGL